jgi:hypothetical protein
MDNRIYKLMSSAYSFMQVNGWGVRYDEAKTIRPP